MLRGRRYYAAGSPQLACGAGNFSHRLVNVKNADQIVVMQHGRCWKWNVQESCFFATNDEYERNDAGPD